MSAGIQEAQFTKGRDRQHIADVQREFIRDAARRFERIRGDLRRKVGYDEDFFGLKAGTPTQNTPNQRARFRRWLVGVAMSALGLEVGASTAAEGQHWTAPLLTAAAVQGFNQGTGQLLQAGVTVDNPANDIVRERVQETLTGRETLRDLIGDGRGRPRYIAPLREFERVTEDMATRMDAVLDEGFGEGWNPKRMADEMTAEVRKVERSRAMAIARTETSFAHAEESLKRYHAAGIEGIGHVGRIVTPDESLCAWCRAIADETFTLREFAGTRVLWRGQRWFVGVPAHPNGRCAPIPKPGVDADGLPPIEERLPAGARVIGSGFMYDPRTVT